LASSSGLLSAFLPPSSPTNIESFNTSTVLKLGPPPKTEKLKEQVVATLQETQQPPSTGEDPHAMEAEGVNGTGQPNGDGDVDMQQQVLIKEIEPDVDPDVTSPEAGETFPPIPAVFRTADLKREVEAVRDKRRMIRLGPGANVGKSVPPATVLPSVVAFTMFDNGEG
jgi:transcription initiation factor TFIID subunit 5